MASQSQSEKPLDTFEGWCADGPEAAAGKMKWGPFKPKDWEETDIDIKITHCGICGSDLHTLRSGWSPTLYPCVVGHEIVGHIERVGKDVKGFKVGDRVGVGAQIDSCFGRSGPCRKCDKGLAQFCPKGVFTYSSVHMNGDRAYGGYSTHVRAPHGWVFQIPDEIPSEEAAPMLCAGVTAYRPLKHNGVGPGKKVGVIGLGGLGHFGVLWAKAMGADEVVAISRRRNKEKDALALGADRYIATADDEDWIAKNAGTLDVVICTVSNADMPLSGYLSLVDVDGKLIMLGAPDDKLPALGAFDLLAPGAFLGGTRIGSPDDIRDMLKFAAEKKVKPWVKVLPMSEANRAIIEFEEGKPRYRYVLAVDGDEKEKK